MRTQNGTYALAFLAILIFSPAIMEGQSLAFSGQAIGWT